MTRLLTSILICARNRTFFPLTRYKVEWDAIGLEGYYAGASTSDSLLYSSVDVQAVEVSASRNDVGGYFLLSYRYIRYRCRNRVLRGGLENRVPSWLRCRPRVTEGIT